MFVRTSTLVLSLTVFILACCSVGLIVYTLKKECWAKTSENETSQRLTASDETTTSYTSSKPTTSLTHPPPVYPWENFRLSPSVYPLEYDLFLWPDLDNGTFTGKVNITVEVSDHRQHFIVHKVNLEISKSNVYRNGVPVDVKRSFEYEKNEFFVLETEKQLPGLYVLSYEFRGSLTGSIVGFYRSQYFDPVQNVNRYLATSKFQPTFARRAFPCFDEPTFKSNFTVSLVHSKDLIALSNMPVEKQTEFGGSDLVLTTFEESVPMVTYLACFIVCDFKFTSVNISGGREVRVYSTPHQVQNTEYSLELSQKLTLKYEEYFKIDYPLPKQDLIAIPDFVSGAMEHWGIITFRETNLLFDKRTTGPQRKQRIAEVVAHELAHMWFGNLVTMKWWDDLWLNEGFASFFEYKGVNWAHPKWNMMDQFLIADVQPVMELDATSSSHPIVQTVSHPDEITEIFDMISYSKGASVIRMLEFFMGKENFQQGISNFLMKYKYGNAQTEDLWREMSKVNSVKTIKDISEIMDTWTKQQGFPVVRIKAYPDGSHSVVASQEIFLKDRKKRAADKSVWSIPLSYITSDGDEGLLWMHDKNEVNISFNKSPSLWWKFNINQTGYYLVNYDLSVWKTLSRVLLLDHEALSASDRSNLLFDAFMLSSAGDIEYKVALDMSRYLVNETHYTPWSTAYDSLTFLHDLLEFTEANDYMKKYIQKLVLPIYTKLGWKDSSDHSENLLRGTVLKLACKSGNRDCLKTASEKFRDWMKNKATVPTTLVKLIYGYGVSELGNDDYWNAMWERYLNEASAQERNNLMYGLAQVRRPHLLYRFLDFAMDESKIRRQDFFTCLSYIASNTVGRPIVWDFLRYNWPKLVKRFTLNERYLGRAVKSICDHFTTEYHLQEMKDFFKKYPDAGAGSRARLQTLEVVENNVQWLKLYKEKVTAWLMKEME